MKKLERILLTAGFITGITLTGVGLYKDTQYLRIIGMTINTICTGKVLRYLVDEEDYNPKDLKEK